MTPKAIKARRVQAGLSQTAAAALVFKTKDAWCKWESGARKMDILIWVAFNIALDNPEAWESYRSDALTPSG